MKANPLFLFAFGDWTTTKKNLGRYVNYLLVIFPQAVQEKIYYILFLNIHLDTSKKK